MIKKKVLSTSLGAAFAAMAVLSFSPANAASLTQSDLDKLFASSQKVEIDRLTYSSPVFGVEKKENSFKFGSDGNGTLIINSANTVGDTIFGRNDQIEGGVIEIQGNLVLNLNLKNLNTAEGYNGLFGGDNPNQTFNNVKIKGDFELNGFYDGIEQKAEGTYIPYFYSNDGGSDFEVTGNVKISIITIAPTELEKPNSSTQAFTFIAGDSHNTLRTINVGNENSSFYLLNAYYRDLGSKEETISTAGANGVYAYGATDININAGKKVQIISIADYADAISAKKGGIVNLGSPELLQVIGAVDFFNSTGSSDGSATSARRQSQINGTFQGEDSFWFGDEKLRYDAKPETGQHGGDLNFTFKDGAEWIYMTNPRLTKITLEDDGAINMYDDYVLKLWTEKIIDLKTNYLPEYGSLSAFWPSVLKDGQLAHKHQIVAIDKLNGNNGVFRMDFDSFNKKDTDLVFIGNSDNTSTGEFKIQAHPEDPEDLVNSFGNVSDDNPLLFAYVAKPAADKIVFKDHPNLYNHKLYDYYAKIETRTYDEMKDKLSEYDTNYSDLYKTHDALELYGNKEDGTYWVITNIVTRESNTLVSLEAAGESGWGYATYLDRLAKRMGEIQYQDGNEGLWIRGRYSRLGKSSYDMKWGGVQFGGDYKNTERNRIGVALAFDNGKADFNKVDGKNDLHGFNLMAYDTWRHEDGWYLDATARYGKFHNKSHVKTPFERVSSNYRQSIFSLGLEGGKRMMLNEQHGIFMEPQLQVQWASVGKASWKTNNDIQAKIKRGNSFIGRAGTQLGKEWVDSKNRKNNVYVKADVLHEFGNGQKAEFSADGLTAKRKWGAKGTWYDAGVSGQFALGKQSWAHLDLEVDVL